MTDLEKLQAIVTITDAYYPLRTKEHASSVYINNNGELDSAIGLGRVRGMSDEDTGIFYYTPFDGALVLHHDPAPIKKILDRIRENIKAYGKKYKPTMDAEAKRNYLILNHNKEWRETRAKQEDILDEQYPTFCICGQLATGLHTSRCKKWQKKLDSMTVATLKGLLPKLTPITIPEE